ncbi:uncharacterized protein LOC114438258 [Parambassis ranga]|uniref:Uncharacterized protein LOC114438258 n=1 Tax=Parambassis ranga TaxID=210632 RepID=A0A6P7II78_9TELE|nr:uncharacterized protein LOC114438258 [Parambassis ranga]
MDQSAIVMSDDTEGNTRTNRGLQLPSCFSSWPASALSVFCIGLVSGAVGGLLLGETAVIELESLEILADNRLLMEELENYIMGFLRQNNNSSKKQDMLAMTRDEEEYTHNIFISLLFEEFGVFSSTLSLPGGAAKICATAAASGGAVLAVVKSVLPVLGPGPTIGALMGVSGAVGVTLSAARAATDHYGQTVDRHGKEWQAM